MFCALDENEKMKANDPPLTSFGCRCPPRRKPGMKGLYLVEPVVALYAFSTYLTYPLVPQYVYRRLWQQLTNSSYPVADNASACANASDGDNRTFYFQASCQPSDKRRNCDSVSERAAAAL